MLRNNLNHLIKFHHLGLAVRSINKVLDFYKNMGYKCTELIIDKFQNVEIIMCMSGIMPWIEIISPLGEQSPINNYLRYFNENIYHICYKVQNIEEVLAIIRETNRIVCVNKSKPAIMFNNKLVSFYYIKGVGLFEFLED